MNNEQHVYARLNGFQLQVIPRAPFRIGRCVDVKDAVDIEYQSKDGLLFARLIPDGGGYKSKLDQNTSSLYDVVDVNDGNNSGEWIIETSVFDCCWPVGYAICSNNFPNDPSPFDLIGGDSEFIYIQRPQKCPAIEEMYAQNQSVVDIGKSDISEWINLEYVHENERWNLRHEVVSSFEHPLIVTMQSPERYAHNAKKAAYDIVQSLVLHQHH